MSLTDLVYKISADSSPFSKELKSAERDVAKFQKQAKSEVSKVAKAFAALGAAAATGLAAMVRQSIDAADELAKMSRRTGVATEDLSTLGFALEQSGSSLGAFETAARRLNQSIDQTADGTGVAARRFKQLGIDVKGADGSLRQSIDVFRDLADRLKDLPDGATKTAIAIDVLGKSGTELIPLLNGGSEGLDNFRAEAEKLGLVIGQDTAEAAERFNDSLNRGRQILVGFANRVMPQVLSAFEAYTSSTNTATGNTEDMQGAVDGVGTAFRVLLLGLEGIRTAFALTSEAIALFFARLVTEAKTEIDIVGALFAGLGKALAASARGQFGSIKEIIQATNREVAAAGEEGSRKVADITENGQKNIQRILDESKARILAIEESKNSAIEKSEKTAAERISRGDAQKAAEDAARRRAAALRAQESAAREAAAAQKAFLDDLDRRAARVINSVKTSEDKLSEGKVELNELLLMGVISVKQYGAALEVLEQKYDPVTIASREMAKQIEAEADSVTRSAEAFALSLRTPLEEYASSLEQYQRLLDSNAISQATFDLAVEQSTRRLADQVGEVKKTESAFKSFGESAANGIFDAFADGLFDPLNFKFDEALQNFIIMLGKMALEAAKQAAVQAIITGATGAATGVPVPLKLASGGYVSGPGTGTSDSIDAKLSNGEFVIPASKTKELGVGWLYSLIRGKHKPGKTRFAEGGLVGGVGGDMNVTNVNFFDPRELDDYLQSRAGEKVIVNVMRRNRNAIA